MSVSVSFPIQSQALYRLKPKGRLKISNMGFQTTFA